MEQYLSGKRLPDRHNVVSLQPLGAVRHDKFDFLPFFHCAVSVLLIEL